MAKTLGLIQQGQRLIEQTRYADAARCFEAAVQDLGNNVNFSSVTDLSKDSVSLNAYYGVQALAGQAFAGLAKCNFVLQEQYRKAHNQDGADALCASANSYFAKAIKSLQIA